MEVLGCAEALVLVVVMVNGLGLWGWSEFVSVQNIRLLFEVQKGCQFIPLP